MKISQLKQGQKFKYGNIPWVKLDSDRIGVLAITAESMFVSNFDKYQWNCWSASPLRKGLNREFLIILMSRGCRYEHLRPLNTDLTAKDGMGDYGKDADTISMLTSALYLQYKEWIPNIKQSYWTATPWSCKEEYLNCMCAIDAQGKLVREFANEGKLGVRPLCKLKNTIQVEIV